MLARIHHMLSTGIGKKRCGHYQAEKEYLWKVVTVCLIGQFVKNSQRLL
jgi:hypothetical protein